MQNPPLIRSLVEVYTTEEAKKHFPQHNGKLPDVTERTEFWCKCRNDFKDNILVFKKETIRNVVINFINYKIDYFNVIILSEKVMFRNGEDMLFVKLSFPECFN